MGVEVASRDFTLATNRVLMSVLLRIWRDALLLLTPVAEPHPHHLLLHEQLVADHPDFLRTGFWVIQERFLQGVSDVVLDGGSLLPAFANHVVVLECGHGYGACGRADSTIGILQPLLQQRLQLAHVLEGEVERFEPRDGRLGEVVAIHPTHGQAHVALGVAKLDPPLLELFGKFLQLLQLNVLVGRQVKTGHGMAGRVTGEGWWMVGLLMGWVTMVERLEWRRGEGMREGEG